MRARRTIFWGVLGALARRISSQRCSAERVKESLGRAMPEVWHGRQLLVKSFMRHCTRFVAGKGTLLGAARRQRDLPPPAFRLVSFQAAMLRTARANAVVSCLFDPGDRLCSMVRALRFTGAG